MKLERIGMVGRLFAGCERLAEGMLSGWEPAPSLLWFPASEAEAVASAGLVDGWVLLDDEGLEPLAVISRHGGPVVARSARYLPQEVPVVAVNERRVGEIAGDYLRERYPGPFVFVGSTVVSREEMLAGFRQRVGTGVKAIDAGEAGLRPLLEGLPPGAGAFCATDAVARQVARMALGLGKRIPAHLALVGVDNTPTPIEGPNLALTTVPLPLESQGHLIAEDLRREADLAGVGFLRLADPEGILARASA